MLKRNVSQVYLSLVPILVAISGFGIGHISYKIYLPIWIVNICLMIISSWILGLKSISGQDQERKHLATGAFFLIVPWLLVSMFFGLGPPPQTSAEWVATANEQQARYLMLVIAAIFIILGFAILRHNLKSSAGDFYSMLGFTAIMVAIPLFIINMIWWGTYLVEFFRIVVASGSDKRPEWFLPIRIQFEFISVVEVALTYLATAFFAASLGSAGWFKKTATRIYIFFSLLGLMIVVGPFINGPVKMVIFFVSIPAIPFLMHYFIGINLLRRAGN